MKNLLQLSCLLVCFTIIASCGKDDDNDTQSCTQSDFVGIYTINGSVECSADATLEGPEAFFLEAGQDDNTVLENGEEDLVLTITDCTATDDFVSYTLNGNQITLQLGECMWTYTKN